jgi:hypothetical protein
MNPFLEVDGNRWQGAEALFNVASAARPDADQGSLNSLVILGENAKNSEKKEFLPKPSCAVKSFIMRHLIETPGASKA